MNPTPSGVLRATDAGVDIEVTRSFRSPASDVWQSITDPEWTARWYGPWTGMGEPGGTVTVRMDFEDGAPSMDMTVDACDAPTRLALSTTGDDGDGWRMELRLAESDGTTVLTLIHHRPDTDGVGEIGPGWEYYLDMLVAARSDAPLPDFDSFYPAQKPYYEALEVLR